MSAPDETLDSRASGHAERVPVTETLVRGQIVDGRYEIGELLGEGAMGSVLAARHVVLKTRLAIKVMRPELTLDAEAMARFRQEAQVVGAIGHPNIVDVRDFGTLPSPDGVTAGASYFVMEHLEGRELGAVLFEDGPFPVERAVHVVSQMAEALDAAHARGVVHRDVKPANTLLVREGSDPDHVKMLDFGIAKLDSSRLTRRARILGTPAYMAPEQAQGAVVDARADVYALTIVLFELLTGRLPLDDPHPFKLLRKQVTDAPPSILELRPELPVELASLIARGLEKKPADRIPSMRALIESLEPFARSRRPTPTPAVSRISSLPVDAPLHEAIALETPPAASVVMRTSHAPRASHSHDVRTSRTRTAIALGTVALAAILGAAFLVASATSLLRPESRGTLTAHASSVPRAAEAASSLQLARPTARDTALEPREGGEATAPRAPAPTIATPTIATPTIATPTIATPTTTTPTTTTPTITTPTTTTPTIATTPPPSAVTPPRTETAPTTPTRRARRRARPPEPASVTATAPASEPPVDRSAIDPWY